MSNGMQIAAFDYAAVDKDTKSKLISLAGLVKRHKKAFTDHGMEIGQAVSAAHELLSGAGRDGKFSIWVEAETDLDIRMAYNCMYVFERSKKHEIISSFPPTVAYLMAAPTVSDEAIRDFAKQVSKGTRATVANAKATLDKFREASDKPKPSTRRTSAPKKPAADEPPQSAPIDAPKAEEPTAKKISGGATFDPAELETESKDAFGDEPPDDLQTVFELRVGFKEQRQKLTSIKTWMTQNQNHPGAVVLSGAAQRILTDINQADSELKFSSPYCVCVYCRNKKPKVTNCNACKGLGWITEPIYDQAPKALKA